MRPLPIEKCPLIFCDVETSGLEDTDEILELAWMKTDATAERILAAQCVKVVPKHPERIKPQAAAINGYTAAVWAAEAIPLRQALTGMVAVADNSVFIAHRVEFDWGFVSRALAAEGLKWPGRYHRVDTCALAWPLLHSGRVKDMKLATLVQHFGQRQAEAHRAESDVRDCRTIYVRFMQLWNDLLDAAPYGEPVRMT